MPKAKNSDHARLDWLPFESWLIPDIFRFSRVRGWARIFLIIEMLLASIIVLCTFCIAILHIAGK